MHGISSSDMGFLPKGVVSNSAYTNRTQISKNKSLFNVCNKMTKILVFLFCLSPNSKNFGKEIFRTLFKDADGVKL